MNEFDNLKNSYIATIQLALAMNVNYNEVKHGNELLHKFCENYIDNTGFDKIKNDAMKMELELLKESLSKEIEGHYKR